MIQVENYIGLEFEEKGRGPKYDCWGLHLYIAERAYSITGLPDFRNSYRHTGDRKAISECIGHEKHNWRKVSDPEEGAVIVFALGGIPQHVGTCTGFSKGHPMFLHIHKKINATHERLTSSIWNNRIDGIYVYD